MPATVTVLYFLGRVFMFLSPFLMYMDVGPVVTANPHKMDIVIKLLQKQ